MPSFQYKARGTRGEPVDGIIDSASADAAAAQLINTGVTPITIVQVDKHTDVLKELSERLQLRKPGLVDLILFSRQMYTLMKAGVPIIRAMTGLSETTRNPLLARTIGEIVTHLESGRDLASALSMYPALFSSLFVSIVRLGESSGRLDESFLQLAQYLELEKDTRERIKTALRYPSFVMIGIVIAIAIINIKVIPAFAGVFASFKTELPWATQLLIKTSAFFVAYWPYMLALALLAVFGFRYYINTEPGRYRWGRAKLRLPVVGDIINRATLARFARSFAMCSKSGVPLIQALTVVARAVDNDFVAERILQMRNGIERGDTLTRTAAATGMFTPLVLQMFAVGEETGAVDDLLQEVAGYYEREVDYDLKNLSDKIEPLVLVAVGVLVLILALGVFLPMWELSSAAKAK